MLTGELQEKKGLALLLVLLTHKGLEFEGAHILLMDCASGISWKMKPTLIRTKFATSQRRVQGFFLSATLYWAAISYNGGVSGGQNGP